MCVCVPRGLLSASALFEVGEFCSRLGVWGHLARGAELRSAIHVRHWASAFKMTCCFLGKVCSPAFLTNKKSLI